MTHLESLFGLKGKVAVITGGARGRGIGKCAAESMAAAGADIVIFDILDDLAAQAAKEIADKYQVRAVSYHCDVTDPVQVKARVAEAAEKMGTLDLLFNNAGIVEHSPAEDTLPEDWLKVVDVNLNGVFYMAQAFGKWIITHNKEGAIVNTASMSATIVNIPQVQASYNATKAAVKHLTKTLAVEWATKGIRVNCISPGYIKTDLTAGAAGEKLNTWLTMSPGHRLGVPQELAGAILYLFSPSASFTTGCDIIIDGGFTVV